MDNIEEQEEIIQNPELNIIEALIPLVFLIILLSVNVFFFKDDALGGSNQFVLLLGGAVAGLVGYFNKVKFSTMIDKVSDNIRSTTGAILILLMVGALAGSWLISGVIPSMIYYGLLILKPSFFLPATVVICAIISIATGSSWTTSATVGIALIGIGQAMGVSTAMVAGAVLSGAYFGDKMSPLSDTTNLASAMAETDLFTHIRYMMITTVPSITVTLVVFIILSFSISTTGAGDVSTILEGITEKFYVSPVLFLVPLAVILMIVKKTKPLLALLSGSLLGILFAVIFQPEIVLLASGEDILNFKSYYMGSMNALTSDVNIESSIPALSELFSTGGMKGMMGTVLLIICAMAFGGIMEAIGALARISQALLSLAKSVFGLFLSTVASCLALNISASDQYLAIVVPGKMFKNAYTEKNLAPENLSRTLEDSGTVTSVLVPWNTCGAYQSSVLGVSVFDYFIYAIFNYLSPIMTLAFALLSIKIRKLVD